MSGIVIVSNTTSVSISFNALVDPDIGNSTITQYQIFMNDGSGVGYVLVKNTTSISGNVISPLLKGKIYQFYVKAQNTFGTSLASSSVSALCATAPDQMASPVITQVGTSV